VTEVITGSPLPLVPNIPPPDEDRVIILLLMTLTGLPLISWIWIVIFPDTDPALMVCGLDINAILAGTNLDFTITDFLLFPRPLASIEISNTTRTTSTTMPIQDQIDIFNLPNILLRLFQ
jgi:hypothetical protein